MEGDYSNSDEKNQLAMDAEKPTSAAHLEAVSQYNSAEDRHTLLLAKDASAFEHHLSPLEAIKAFPMAIFWSLLVSMCVIMEGMPMSCSHPASRCLFFPTLCPFSHSLGYDTILIGNFYAYPSFARKYGNYSKSAGTYQLTAAWQDGVGNASGVGAFFGVMINGWLVAYFGQKRTLLASLLVLSAFVFMTFFAPNIGVLTAGEVLCGLPWGVFASTAPAYASEVLPMSLRIYLTSYTNMYVLLPVFYLPPFFLSLQHQPLTLATAAQGVEAR